MFLKYFKAVQLNLKLNVSLRSCVTSDFRDNGGMNPKCLYGNFSKPFYCASLLTQIRHLVLCGVKYLPHLLKKNLQENLPNSDLIDFAEREAREMGVGKSWSTAPSAIHSFFDLGKAFSLLGL